MDDGSGWFKIKTKEDRAFEDLEKKIGVETIDCRSQVTSEMRKWFRETYDHAADDCSVLKKWRNMNMGSE